MTSSWGNGHATTYRGLLGGLRERGHSLCFFERDVEWYAAHRDLAHPPQAELTLYRHWADIRPRALRAAREADAVIVGSYFPDAVAAVEDLLRHPRPLLCFYDIDTPVTLQALRTGQCAYLRAGHIPFFDLYLSFTGGPVLAELRHTWRARLVRPLYCACDQSAYQQARRAAAPAFALSFLGTYAPDRQHKLQRLLLAVAQAMPQERFQVAGSMFPHPEIWPHNVAYVSHLAPAAHPAFYASSRFTLNLTRQAMVEAGFSPSVRLFEAGAAATPIITDPWPGLEQFFQPEVEILLARSTADVTRILSTISLDEAAVIGRAGQMRVLAAHTCQQRARELEGYLEEAAECSAITSALPPASGNR
ncbi:MAG: CgeB family protein [Terriglobales bacterium]